MRGQMLAMALRGGAVPGSGGGGGGGGGTVSFSNINETDTESAESASCSFAFYPYGEFSAHETILSWLTGSSDGSLYDIRVTPTAGSFTVGTVSTWLNLGTDRFWSVTRASVGVKQCVSTVEVRNASTLTVLCTATFTITAERL